MNLFKSIPFSTINAGFITVLVGFTSSIAIVFQAAQTLGADTKQTGSWILALCLGMGVTGIILSLRYRIPITTAWSTSGAAMLATSSSGVTIHEAIGAFLLTGLLIAFSGFSGIFQRIMSKIPFSLAAGMLSGILFNVGLNAFVAAETQTFLVVSMLLCYVIALTRFPRYAVLIALAVGCTIASQQSLIAFDKIELSFTEPVFVLPHFSLQALIGITLPLFMVTMASQNLPGLTILLASDYHNTPISPLIGWTGFATMFLSVFGAYAINLATITSAICIAKEAHKDPEKRYIAAIVAGVCYIIAGLFGTTIVTAFSAFPQELIYAIAGLALLGTVGNALAHTVAKEKHREAAIVTLLVTASGVELLSIGSAFWGMVAGVITLTIMQRRC